MIKSFVFMPCHIQQKINLTIYLYAMIVTIIFSQAVASLNIKEPIKLEKNTRADSKNTKKILNLKASSQNWANREDDFVAHAWDMYWEGINSILKNIYLPFTKKYRFGKRIFFYYHLTKLKKIYWWCFQTDE